MIDRKKLFDGIRPLFGGKMNAGQVAGVEVILDEWQRRPDLTDLRWLAYMLATVQHETAATMQPIHEYGDAARFTRLYDIEGKNPALASALGNTRPGDGVRFAGRGYVQLTGRANYAKAGKAIGIDLVADPDAALRPDVAVKILFDGMIGGWFTGRALRHYFTKPAGDWVNARRIINGNDKAAKISDKACRYYVELERT